ncbi:beta-ketoacyl-[acyl-carrier-protein] synthase family protein [Spirillospora sp. NPDC048911]|uniref:beta-ketoacyl-[acyl-carrier-protein] synthase family protein n=1 Tax=Spirillospora sp. NPDC048911 TaxID=3364527 RepID=UPI00371B5E0D
MPAPDVVITGLGLVTAAGIGTAATWQGVCAGRSPAVRQPQLDGLGVDFACHVPQFDADAILGKRLARTLDRGHQFALTAAMEAVADAGLDPRGWDGTRVGVVLGSAIGGIASLEDAHGRLLRQGPRAVPPLTMPKVLNSMVAGQVARVLEARGPSLASSAACASGSAALHLARDLLRAGSADIMICGGVDASLTPLVVAAFDRLGALSRRRDDPAAASRPFDADRDGFVMGEGAGVLVLERAAGARARGRTPYAGLAGCGSTNDCHHPTAPDPEGRGAEAAIRLALADAGADLADVDHINAHGTGTRLNDAVEAQHMHRLMPAGVPVTANKGVLGHTLAASGAIEAALTALTLREGMIPPVANLDRQDPDIKLDMVTGQARSADIELALSNSFGFGGHNVVLALAQP